MKHKVPISMKMISLSNIITLIFGLLNNDNQVVLYSITIFVILSVAMEILGAIYNTKG